MSVKLNINVEERTYDLTIACPEGGPYRVIARRHRILTNEDGSPVRDAQGEVITTQGGERVIERVVDGTDAEAQQIAALVSAKIDKWAMEG